MSDRDTADFLGTVPLLEGREEADLAELARLVRRRTVQEGERARELVFIVDGSVAALLHAPGNRVVEIGTAGPGEIVGEIGLLDGGEHAMSVRVTSTATVLALARRDFAALLALRDPAAFRLKRRLASQFTMRLRNQLGHLAANLGDELPGRQDDDAKQAFANLEFRGPPDSKYLSRIATFHEFDPVALWGFLTSGRYALCPRGHTLMTEGAPSAACYLTINGAVEKVLLREDRRIRVGLAGPGKAFGYEGLIDGRPSSITAIARERALLLVLPHEHFMQLFEREDTISEVFLDVILRDLTATLRQTLRLLASSV